MDSNSQPLSACQRLMNFIMSKLRSPTPPDTAILAEHKHKDHPENSTPTEEGTTVQKGWERKERKQDSSAPDSDRKTGAIDRGKGLQEVSTGTDARGKRPKKSVTIKESVKEEQTDKTKDGKLLADRPHEGSKLKPPRHWGPLQSVASHINEKSDAYISSRKDAMKKNLSLDPEKS